MTRVVRNGEDVDARQCLASHRVFRASVGSAYLNVAMKYRDGAGALEAVLKISSTFQTASAAPSFATENHRFQSLIGGLEG